MIYDLRRARGIAVVLLTAAADHGGVQPGHPGGTPTRRRMAPRAETGPGS